MIIPTIIKAIGGKIARPLLNIPSYKKHQVLPGTPLIYLSQKVLLLQKQLPVSTHTHPLPIPSNNAGAGLLPIAKASKRPIIIQLVIIKPTNTDSCLLTS
jgi:hypothetical protein